MSNFPDFCAQGYQVISELGRNSGGGRVVYLAQSLSDSQQKVVIKQFQFAKGSGWSEFKAIEREMQTLKDLKHSGIPAYLGSFENDEGFCIVQEHKNAQPLSVPRSFDSDEVEKIAVSVLEILIYLQSRIPPVIHRDIKPENVLVDEQLNVYLIDFGFARIGGGEVATSSMAAGTFGFMAPEQMYNKGLTEATDLYGLGSMLIALLTTTKSTAMDTLINDDGKITFKHLVPKLNLRFIGWLERMVAPKLKDRYLNAEIALKEMQPLYEMKLDLRRIGLASLVIIPVIMLLTNPRKDSYIEYASWKFTADVQNAICKKPELPEFLNGLSGNVSEVCKSVVTSNRKTIRDFVDNYSKQDNYICVSIFTTEIVGKRYRTIGVFSNFWTFESE